MVNTADRLVCNPVVASRAIQAELARRIIQSQERRQTGTARRPVNRSGMTVL
jgi:hypothetical protein